MDQGLVPPAEGPRSGRHNGQLAQPVHRIAHVLGPVYAGRKSTRAERRLHARHARGALHRHVPRRGGRRLTEVHRRRAEDHLGAARLRRHQRTSMSTGSSENPIRALTHCSPVRVIIFRAVSAPAGLFLVVAVVLWPRRVGCRCSPDQVTGTELNHWFLTEGLYSAVWLYLGLVAALVLLHHPVSWGPHRRGSGPLFASLPGADPNAPMRVSRDY
jgi:hypothetical protein